jgi:hypothetical protein
MKAWEVEIHSMICIVFAETKAKACWQAVKGYRNAFGHRKGYWPRPTASRATWADSSPLRDRDEDQRAWSPEYVRNSIQ